MEQKSWRNSLRGSAGLLDMRKRDSMHKKRPMPSSTTKKHSIGQPKVHHQAPPSEVIIQQPIRQITDLRVARYLRKCELQRSSSAFSKDELIQKLEECAKNLLTLPRSPKRSKVSGSGFSSRLREYDRRSSLGASPSLGPVMGEGDSRTEYFSVQSSNLFVLEPSDAQDDDGYEAPLAQILAECAPPTPAGEVEKVAMVNAKGSKLKRRFDDRGEMTVEILPSTKRGKANELL
eukprot:TRINITY_DN5297_c0_g1_i3.p1 TRINITY_DN5297_c0_g1~~TRINITY_DN5297_c0_g1_i3.p1  ORF type:complete len:233 (+),score=41.59 TRINITY_DN5297_c0_g1_i3:200-898(+)